MDHGEEEWIMADLSGEEWIVVALDGEWITAGLSREWVTADLNEHITTDLNGEGTIKQLFFLYYW